MRITSVELENIKSYGERTCIEFTEGLNAVCGLNGSGKTTVLEAIGWALFDFLPYPQQAFLREGERSGTVRVRLLAPDGREYEVVRRIGSGSAYYVSDVELNARLADRVDNVLDWVRTYAMDMDGETDLKALFRNAVGVPQGLMTSVFLESASVRKGIFDPLLRVEEYGRACEYLRDTVNYLRNLSGTVKEEIAGLMTDVERIPSAREEVEDLQDQLHQSDERLAGLVTELSDVEGRKAALDEVELRLRELQGELAGSAYDVQRHADMLAVQEHALATAIEAERVVGEAEPGYRLVLAARDRLAALEQHRLERDRLEREKTEVRTRMRGIHEQIERLDRELLAALGAAEKAAELAEAVARQSELEERVQQATPRAGDGDRLDRQIVTIRREIDELERARAASQRAIEEARRALEDSGRLGDVQDRLQQTRDQLATMEPIRQQQESIQSEGSRLRKRYDALHAELQRKDELQRQLANLETVTVEAETLSRQLRELREERVRVVATIEYRSVARTDLERWHCPLLDLQCPAVTDDAGLLGRFDDRGRELPARAAALETELAALEERVVAAQAAQVEVQRLHVELAPLTRSEGELPEVQERLEECREQYRAFSDILSTKDELEGERRALEAELAALQQARERAGRLPLLEEQREGERRRLEARNEDLRALEGQRAELAALEEQARSIAAELGALDDPRSRQQRLLVQAERRAELETSQRQHEQRLTEDSDRLKAVVGRLQQYTALDEEMEVQRSVERDHGGEYERFLKNEAEAGQCDARREAVDGTRSALETARKAERDVRQRLDDTATSYDAERHDSLKRRYIELHKAVSEETKHREHVTTTLLQREEQLAYLRRQETKLQDRRGELDELEGAGRAVAFIRETIKAAGPAITETLLANISQTANDIFAEILDDHSVELRWDRDYEVLVQRGAETRKFSQLSGGEQMSAALAVRLALLKEMSDINFAFFDEPTQNMDGERRSNLADQIRQVRGFDQLIVISHDDTFEHHTDNLVLLRKAHEETQLDVG